jgi:ATP-dependent Clp protease ATP-binding subunit ClpB
MDEAASRIRMEIDSKPEELDRKERRLIQLKIQREALKKEKDAESKQRLADLEAEIGAGTRVQRPGGNLEGREGRRAGRDQDQGADRAAKLELEAAQRQQDLRRASEIQYGRLPELESSYTPLQETEQKGFKLLQDKVTAEEIAEVVSRAGPAFRVSKMLEGEREKLLKMEDALLRAWSARTRR